MRCERGSKLCPHQACWVCCLLEIVQQRLSHWTSGKWQTEFFYWVRVWGRGDLWSVHEKWGEFHVGSWHKGRMLLGLLMEVCTELFWWLKDVNPFLVVGSPVSCVLWVVRLRSLVANKEVCKSALEHQVAGRGTQKVGAEYFVWSAHEGICLLTPDLHCFSTGITRAFLLLTLEKLRRWRSKHLCTVSCFSHVQLFVTLWTSPPGSSVCGVLQARIPEWVAISFSMGSSLPRDWTHVSYVSCIGRQALYH